MFSIFIFTTSFFYNFYNAVSFHRHHRADKGRLLSLHPRTYIPNWTVYEHINSDIALLLINGDPNSHDSVHMKGGGTHTLNGKKQN